MHWPGDGKQLAEEKWQGEKEEGEGEGEGGREEKERLIESER